MFLPSFFGLGHDLDMYSGALQLKQIGLPSTAVASFSMCGASLWLPWRSFYLCSFLPLKPAFALTLSLKDPPIRVIKAA